MTEFRFKTTSEAEFVAHIPSAEYEDYLAQRAIMTHHEIMSALTYNPEFTLSNGRTADNLNSANDQENKENI